MPSNTALVAETKQRRLTQEELQQAIQFRLKGLTYQEIADHYGVTRSAIHQRLSPLLEDEIDVALYKGNRADIFAGIQARICKNLTDDKLEKASAYQLTGMLGIFHENERLERGQSTANVQQLSILVNKISERSYAGSKIVSGPGTEPAPQDVVSEPAHNDDNQP